MDISKNIGTINGYTFKRKISYFWYKIMAVLNIP